MIKSKYRLIALLLSLSLLGAFMVHYFDSYHRQARDYRSTIASLLKMPSWKPPEQFPKDTVCFVPEHRYAPHYVEDVLKGHVVFSEGDESDGYWSLIILDKMSKDAWVLQVALSEALWEGGKFICPDEVRSLESTRGLEIFSK